MNNPVGNSFDPNSDICEIGLMAATSPDSQRHCCARWSLPLAAPMPTAPRPLPRNRASPAPRC